MNTVILRQLPVKGNKVRDITTYLYGYKELRRCFLTYKTHRLILSDRAVKNIHKVIQSNEIKYFTNIWLVFS